MKGAQVGRRILRWSVAVADRRDHEGLLRMMVSTKETGGSRPSQQLDSMHTQQNLDRFWRGREERAVGTHVYHQACQTSCRS